MKKKVKGRYGILHMEEAPSISERNVIRPGLDMDKQERIEKDHPRLKFDNKGEPIIGEDAAPWDTYDEKMKFYNNPSNFKSHKYNPIEEVWEEDDFEDEDKK